MSNQPDLIVVGASAGGVEALRSLLSSLPRRLPAAVAVVLHVPATGSQLPEILARDCPIPVTHVKDKERLRRGRVYVAPPDRQFLIEDGIARVMTGPRENGHRPAIDPLFRTAAQAFGDRVIGVVLSGALSDGAIGLHLVK